MPQMTSITVRRLPESVKKALRLQAAAKGRSLEEEVRQILSSAAAGEPRRTPSDLAEAIAAIVDPVGGVELDLPLRSPMREPPRFQDWFDDWDEDEG